VCLSSAHVLAWAPINWTLPKLALRPSTLYTRRLVHPLSCNSTMANMPLPVLVSPFLDTCCLAHRRSIVSMSGQPDRHSKSSPVVYHVSTDISFFKVRPCPALSLRLALFLLPRSDSWTPSMQVRHHVFIPIIHVLPRRISVLLWCTSKPFIPT
jgi:hypothetical protein